MSAAQSRPLRRSHAAAKPSRPCCGKHSAMAAWSVLDEAAVKASATSREAQLEQAIAAARLAVIVALRRGAAEDLDLPVVEAEAAIDRRDLRFERALVGQEEPRRAALDDRRRDRAAVDVGERLGGEDDAGVLLAQRLQPFAQLAGKAAIIERKPAFVDDEQGGPAVEAVLDAVEEIGEDRRRGARADQPFGLEGLDLGFAEPLASRRRAAGPRARRRYRAAAPASARSTAAAPKGR